MLQLIDTVQVPANALLLTAALIVLAAAGLWARAGSLTGRPTRRRGR